MVIRLQVPRLTLRRRLNALSGSVGRPTPWRRRPIAFLCYILSASALRPLANRVRAAVSGLDSGEGGGGVNACVLNELFPQFASFRFTGLKYLFKFLLSCQNNVDPGCTERNFYFEVLVMLQSFLSV